jgi:hypothetical protein
LYVVDEIVDSFHGYDKEDLINDFEKSITKEWIEVSV